VGSWQGYLPSLLPSFFPSVIKSSVERVLPIPIIFETGLIGALLFRGEASDFRHLKELVKVFSRNRLLFGLSPFQYCSVLIIAILSFNVF
jgi:hypothetical protein